MVLEVRIVVVSGFVVTRRKQEGPLGAVGHVLFLDLDAHYIALFGL